MKAKFEKSLKKALTKKDYLEANHLIAEAKSHQDQLSEKDRKEIVLSAIFNASNHTEYSLGFHKKMDDQSVMGICNKILQADSENIELADVYSCVTDTEIGVNCHFTYLK